MDDLLKELGGAAQGQTGQTGQTSQAGGPLDELLGVLGGGGLGSILGGAGWAVGRPVWAARRIRPAAWPPWARSCRRSSASLGARVATTRPGLHQIVGNMQANGLGGVAQSWIGNGASQAITPAQVEQVLSSSQLSELAAKSGLPPDQLKSGIAAILPHLVSGLSPNGSLPEPAQVQGLIGQIQGALGGLIRPALTISGAPPKGPPGAGARAIGSSPARGRGHTVNQAFHDEMAAGYALSQPGLVLGGPMLDARGRRATSRSRSPWR